MRKKTGREREREREKGRERERLRRGGEREGEGRERKGEREREIEGVEKECSGETQYKLLINEPKRRLSTFLQNSKAECRLSIPFYRTLIRNVGSVFLPCKHC